MEPVEPVAPVAAAVLVCSAAQSHTFTLLPSVLPSFLPASSTELLLLEEARGRPDLTLHISLLLGQLRLLK